MERERKTEMQSDGMRMRQSRDAAVVPKVKREREIVEEKGKN